MNINDVDFKAKTIVRDKEGPFILKKGFKIVPSRVPSNMALNMYKQNKNWQNCKENEQICNLSGM